MKKINYNISNISPIKLGDSKFNNKLNINEKKDDNSGYFQNKEKDKIGLLSFSSEDQDNQGNLVVEIQKKEKNGKNIKKKELDVNQTLQKSMKKNSKKL